MKRTILDQIDLADDLRFAILTIKRVKPVLGDQIYDDTTDKLLDAQARVLTRIYEMISELNE